MAEMLHRDYTVITANTVEAGLALLRANPLALILTDQRLPGSTGTELMARAIEIAPDAQDSEDDVSPEYSTSCNRSMLTRSAPLIGSPNDANGWLTTRTSCSG